jgi:hypothetical protein
MKALVYYSYGDSDVLAVEEDLPEPHAGPGQVRVRTRATSVNPFDWKLPRRLEVLDWRRRIWSLYTEVRHISAYDPATAHALWRAGRDYLFAHHPASPFRPEARHTFTRRRFAPYDAVWRFELPIQDAEPVRITMSTGSDGIVPFQRIGRRCLPTGDTLDVWRLQTYDGGIFLRFETAWPLMRAAPMGAGVTCWTPSRVPISGSVLIARLWSSTSNFAYNPSCAYDPAWACPLAPPGNTVAEIGVGELYEARTD